MNVLKIVIIISAVWVVSEIVLALARRSPKRQTSVSDKSSIASLWVTISLSITIGVLLGISGIGFVKEGYPALTIIGIILMFLGLIVRRVSIQTLGKYFTVNVAIFDDHKLVTTGPYRCIRHPAYAGSLLSFLGLGLSFSNWLSALIIFVPILVVFLYRIHVEEKALLQAFGDEYAAYIRSTQRLVPLIY